MVLIISKSSWQSLILVKFQAFTKQPMEVFCKKRCSQKGVHKIHRKTSVLETLFQQSCRSKAVKKRLWHKCFPVNLAMFPRTPFLKNTSGRLLLLLAFEKQPPEVIYEKVFLKILQNLQKKHLWFAKFSRTPFLQSTSATATLLKSGTANSVQKILNEYFLSRNINLKSTVQVYNFFLGSINFQCMFSLVYTVYCSQQSKGVLYLKNFINSIGKHPCWSFFLIKLQA